MNAINLRGNYYFLNLKYGCKVEVDGIIYPSAYHAFQASKSNIPEVKSKISKMSFDELDEYDSKLSVRYSWTKKVADILFDINKNKFSQNKKLILDLIKTGTRELVDDDEIAANKVYLSNNMLGKVLMRLRKELTPAPS